MLRTILFFLLVLILSDCRNNPDPHVVSSESAKKGEELFNSVGCLMCHSVKGETRYGPSLSNIFNKEVLVIRNGAGIKVKVDRQYILRSLKDPDFEKVDGFQSKKMTAINLTDDEINYLVDYLIFISTNHEK